MAGDSNLLDTWGNANTMNMNPIVYQNILESRYYKTLLEKETYHEMVNEIFNEVSHVNPFVTGTTASTAFCCLYKLWNMRLTVKQLENMIERRDSPYIRALGFLYLRYVCAPEQLWDWLGYYLEDDQQVNLSNSPKPNMKSIGAFCRMLLTEQKYLSTMLPRIPVLIARDIEKKLQDYDRENKKDNDNQASNRRRDSRSPIRRRDSRSPIRRRDSRSPPRRRDHSPSRRRHDDHRRRDRGQQDDYRRRQRSERDELDDYERRRRRSRSRSRSRDRRRRHDDRDDDFGRRPRRRSPSVTRDRPGEYRRD